MNSAVQKLNQVQVSPKMAAIVEYLVGSEYAFTVSPRVVDMCGTVDGMVLLAHEGDCGANTFLGSKQSLFQNLTGLAAVAGLDQAEVDWLLAQVPETCRVEVLA